MDNSVLKELLKEYDQKRISADLDLEKRKQILYSSNPDLALLDDEINKTAISVAKSILLSKENTSIGELQNKIQELKQKKQKLLDNLNIESDHFIPNYECVMCNDTGYITNNSKTQMCNCLKQKIFDIEYNKSNISNIEKENFDTFNINYYSDKINKELYKSDISPKENIKIIKEIALKFVDNFENSDDKNLIFLGSTGLGKTFLSNCIANEILKKGRTVLYQTAPVMLDSIVDFRFNKPNSSQDLYENLLNVELLIIDDLGTEYLNTIKFTELFNIINTRLLNKGNKITKTIISTNLSLSNLSKNYDERIVSRIRGYYRICPFFGDDIRFIIKK